MKIKSVFALLAFGSGCFLIPLFNPQAQEFRVPRNSFGHPDLQGVWTNATVSVLERPDHFGDQLVLSQEEGQKLEQNSAYVRMKQIDLLPTDPNAPAPQSGAGVGGYNAFWMDPGNRILKVNGEYRTSIITSPSNGKIPYSTAGRAAYAVGMKQRQNFDGPETRPLGERCVVGFGSTGGPPMLPVLYNNHYQIVQSQDTVLILVEMNHDVRIIRLNAEHRELDYNHWLGDSVGRWEGNTLVVETINFHPRQSLRSAIKHRVYIPETAKVTERFTRVADDQILYQFTVEDEQTYTQAWSGEMPFYAVNDRIFEYACHEGNYAMPGILAGARKDEREGRTPNMEEVGEADR